MTIHRDIGWLTRRPIAHRGLHDAARGTHENSASAFSAAVDADFAIECDVRLSADGFPMVFHDETLSRMTSAQGPMAAMTAEELARLRLKGGADPIPTLAELFDLVGGRVPLVVELKGTDAAADAAFGEALAPLLAAYEGQLALMSFDPWLVQQACAFADRIPVGLTGEGTQAIQLERHRGNFGERCSFVSYNVHHLANEFVRWVREERGLPVISWTVRTPADEDLSRQHADQITFEGFLPRG